MTRKITNKILAAVDEDLLTWEQVGKATLSFLNEDDVATMAHNEEFFLYEEELEEEDDEEEEWSPYTADYNDPGSYHHY